MRPVPVVSLVVALALASTMGLRGAESPPEPRRTLIFESSLGQVEFPHEAHFADLEIECRTCHHEHNAQSLNYPHPEYFDDSWLDCGICHHPAQGGPRVAQSCASCHHCPTDCADETLSVKVVVHTNCWRCHEGGTGAEASATCVFCHSGPKRGW